jgi:hypothetical protein
LQYVAKLLHSPFQGKWTESGWGELILEMGILAPVLWVIWSGALVYCSWRVARRLRQTAFFPIAFCILWFEFLLLGPMTFGGTSGYQNYVNNVFLWLLVGMLFRLPKIAAMPEVPPAAIAKRHRFALFSRPSMRSPRLFPQQPVPE